MNRRNKLQEIRHELFSFWKETKFSLNKEFHALKKKELSEGASIGRGCLLVKGGWGSQYLEASC